MVQIKETYICLENSKKNKKTFDLPEQGFEPQIFSDFPTHDLNFYGKWSEEPEIKSK